MKIRIKGYMGARAVRGALALNQRMKGITERPSCVPVSQWNKVMAYVQRHYGNRAGMTIPQ